MKILFFFCILLLPLCTLSQQSDSQLAYTYYQNKEYDKAAELFLKLYERTRSSNFLDYHIICLINGKEYEKAESILKKYLKTDSGNKDFLINLGYIYEQQGKNKKSEEYYDQAIQKLLPHSGDIINLASKFRNIREYGWAIQTYLKGREILKQPDAFMSELGDNYMMERDYQSMINLFVRALEQQPGNINSIISKLNFARSYDLVNSVDQVIENKLAEIQKQKDYPPVFDELIIWYASQKKKYNLALKHAILLNTKSTDKLYTFLNIARDASATGDYNTALQAFQKIIERGKEKNDFYILARKESLNCEYKKLSVQKTAAAQFGKLAEQCESYLQESGYNSNNTEVAILLSDIYAYHLHQPDTANRILERSINMRLLTVSTQNLLKSKRADLLTFMNNPWEATILYTQIEKSNPNNDIGYEAKLKKAWLAYYAGDLLWAKAQFDVLKGATSKLISNDAIKMAHFLHTNYDESGNNQDLQKLAQTEYLLFRQEDKTALPVLDSLIRNSAPGVADYSTLLKADVLARNFQYQEAIQLLETLKENSGQTYIQAEAIFKLAGLKAQTDAPAEAKELYKLLVSEYSGSVYSVEAGRLYRETGKENNGEEAVKK